MKLYDLLDTPNATSEFVNSAGLTVSSAHAAKWTTSPVKVRLSLSRNVSVISAKIVGVNFDDLTLSVFAGHHQPLKIWVSCLHLMSLNISNSQIAQELDLNVSDVQSMAGQLSSAQLREAVCNKQSNVVLSGEVECDEVYIVAGHKGHPEAVKKSRSGRRNRLRGARDEDDDGFHEVHVNTMEGFWSLLRSWLRPHRGISQEKLSLYLGFFECLHNIRKRGKAALSGLLEVLFC